MSDEPVQNPVPGAPAPNVTPSSPAQPPTTPTTDAPQPPTPMPSSEETPPPFPVNLPDEPSTNLGQDAVATPAPPAEDSGPGNLGNIPPVIVTPPAPTRSRAKIVGSILALLILIVGIPAGIFLVGQQQEIRERAAEGGACQFNSSYTSGLLTEQPNPDPNCETQGGAYCNDTNKNLCCYSDGRCYEGQQGACTNNGNGSVTITRSAEIIEFWCPDQTSATGSCSQNQSSRGTQPSGTYTVTERGSGGLQIDAVGLCGSYKFVQPQTGGACPAGTTYRISGTVRDRDGNGINATVCLDPPATGGCSGAALKGTTTSDGSYSISNVPSGGDGHNVYLDPGTLTGFEVSPSVSNPKLVGGDVCYDTNVTFVVLPQATTTQPPPPASQPALPTTSCPTSTSGYYCAANVFALPNQGSGCTNVEKTGGPSCVGADLCWQCTPSQPPGGAPAPAPPSSGDDDDDTSPTITAQCLNVKAYNPTTGAQLTSAQLSQLKAGDTVRLAIGGSTSQPAIDRARFKVNGQFAPDTNGVTTKNSAGEFYYDYTIPAGTTSFSINADLHHTDTSIGWF